MADTTISNAIDVGAVQSGDLVPIARPGLTIPFRASMQEIAGFVSSIPGSRGPQGATGAVGPQGPIGVFNPGSNASSATVQANGSTTLRSLATRTADVVNVRDFGAFGNGATDDTAAIQAAANAIPSGGGGLYLPAGTYPISATILLKSGTRMFGDGVGSCLLATTAWVGGTTYQMVLNASYAGLTLSDHDILIENLQFDYGSFGGSSLPPAAALGATHIVGMYFATRVTVRNCLFQCRGGNDATAMIGCVDTLIEDCRSFGSNNCAYDHWWGPSNGKVLGCYAQGTAGQIVNWNPEATAGHSSTGLAANNFQMTGCYLLSTASTPLSVLPSPLGSGTTVSNVVIQGNILDNCRVMIRGAITGGVVSNNTFNNPLSSPVIQSVTANGGTPVGIVVTNNTLINPTSTGTAPIDVEVAAAVITGNTIIGSAYSTFAGIYTGSFSPINTDNYVSNGTAQNVGSFTKALVEPTVASSGNSDIIVQIGDAVAANSNPFTYSYIVGASSGALGVFGFNSYLNSSGAVARINTTKNGWQFYHDDRDGATDANLILRVTSSSGSTGTAINFNTAGGIVAAASITGTSFVCNLSGPTWTSGTGAPSATTPIGSIFSRTDGGVGTTLYVSRGGGTWNAVSGV